MLRRGVEAEANWASVVGVMAPGDGTGCEDVRGGMADRSETTGKGSVPLRGDAAGLDSGAVWTPLVGARAGELTKFSVRGILGDLAGASAALGPLRARLVSACRRDRATRSL